MNLLMDTEYRKWCTDFDLALTVFATVISKTEGKRIVIDAGLKAVSCERYAQASRRNSHILAEDQAIIVVSHESGVHGWIDGHRFLDPNPPGPAMGDAIFEGEGGAISVLATGDV
jgi:D-serine deaminase-like pyridoxal phosphate-dependent protein